MIRRPSRTTAAAVLVALAFGAFTGYAAATHTHTHTRPEPRRAPPAPKARIAVTEVCAGPVRAWVQTYNGQRTTGSFRDATCPDFTD